MEAPKVLVQLDKMEELHLKVKSRCWKTNLETFSFLQEAQGVLVQSYLLSSTSRTDHELENDLKEDQVSGQPLQFDDHQLSQIQYEMRI